MPRRRRHATCATPSIATARDSGRGYSGYNDGGIAPGGGFIVKVEGDRFGANLLFLPKISGVTPNTLGLQIKMRFGD